MTARLLAQRRAARERAARAICQANLPAVPTALQLRDLARRVVADALGNRKPVRP